MSISKYFLHLLLECWAESVLRCQDTCIWLWYISKICYVDTDITFHSINFHKTKLRKIHWTRFDRIFVLYHIFLVKWTSAYNLGLTDTAFIYHIFLVKWTSSYNLELTDTAFILVFATLEFGTQYIVEWHSVMVYAPKVVHPSEKNQSHRQKCMCTLCKVNLWMMLNCTLFEPWFL